MRLLLVCAVLKILKLKKKKFKSPVNVIYKKVKLCCLAHSDTLLEDNNIPFVIETVPRAVWPAKRCVSRKKGNLASAPRCFDILHRAPLIFYLEHYAPFSSISQLNLNTQWVNWVSQNQSFQIFFLFFISLLLFLFIFSLSLLLQFFPSLFFIFSSLQCQSYYHSSSLQRWFDTAPRSWQCIVSASPLRSLLLSALKLNKIVQLRLLN